MSDRKKDDVDFSETDAIETDEQGRPRVQMESLQKGGSEDDDLEGLVHK